MDKFKIEYKGWRSTKLETGYDSVYFESVVYDKVDNAISFPLILPYRIIESQVIETVDGGTNILQLIKKRNRGWGPKESIFTKELEECGIALAEIFNKYVENNIDLEAESIRWSNSSPASSDLTKIIDEMEDCLIDAKLETEQYYLI